MRDAFIAQLTRIARDNPQVMLITGDLGFGVLTEFAKEFPKQYLNAGVAEQNMTGLATGLALDGRTIFTYSIGNFPTLRCLEQIRNDACYHNANVNVVSIGGGFSYGALGFSHHATEDLAIVRALPDITVTAPGDAWETEQATTAIMQQPGVSYLRLDKSMAPATQHAETNFALGQARTVRDGRDMTLMACGGILGVTLEAAEQLATEGMECRVVSMHTIKPIDEATILAAAQETGGIITVEEHTIDGGLGSCVAEVCLERGVVPQTFYRIGIRTGYSALIGSQSYLRTLYDMDAAAIASRVREKLSPNAVRAISQ